MFNTPDSIHDTGSSPWNFPASAAHSHPSLIPLRLLTPTPSSSSASTPLDLIDPVLRPPPDLSRTQDASGGRVVNGKAGALVKFAEHDNKFAEIARWQDKMKAAVEVRMKTMMTMFREETEKLEERHSEEIRVLRERVDRLEANTHEKAVSDEGESDVESVEMLDVDAAEKSLAATKDNNFLVSRQQLHSKTQNHDALRLSSVIPSRTNLVSPNSQQSSSHHSPRQARTGPCIPQTKNTGYSDSIGRRDTTIMTTTKTSLLSSTSFVKRVLPAYLLLPEPLHWYLMTTSRAVLSKNSRTL
jgi:hypothetical protein